jgi:hypothetical protein
LDELKSDKKWEKSFANTEDILETLADEALNEKRKGETTPIDLDLL